MHANRDYQGGSLRRRGGIVAGLGAASGMLVAALAQLATAPAAGADVTAIVNELDGTLTVAQTALTNASDAFVGGNVPFGLDYGFGALDTYLLSAAGDLAYGGYESLAGVSGPYPDFGFYYIQNPVPLTLADASADATADVNTAEGEFASAATALADGNIATAAIDAFDGNGALIEAPEVEFIGLVDALSGSL
jgi:hypothetical protein